MASSDPVEVAVEIIDQFTDDLEKLEKQLDRIDGKKLSVTLDIDDGGDIEEVKALLKELERNISTKLDVDIRGEKEVLALKKALEKNTKSVHRVFTKGDGVPGGPGGGGGGGGIGRSMPAGSTIEATQVVNDLIDNHLKRLTLDGNPGWHDDFTIGRMGHLFDGNGGIMDMSNPAGDFMGGVRRNPATGLGPDVRAGPMPDRPGLTRPELDRDIRRNRRRNMVGNAVRNAGKMAGGLFGSISNAADGFEPFDFTGIFGGFGKLSKKLAKFKPNIMMWWQLIALLIPMLITLAGAALGVVAAFAAMAVAGAAIVGIGLLGYGDSMEESLDNFKERLQDVGSDVFNILRPVSEAFQPILDGWIGAIPGSVSTLINPLLGMTDFESVLGRAGSGFVSWLGKGLTAMASLSDMIGQIGMRFGSIVGGLIIRLLVWATKEVYNNQDAFISLGVLLGALISILYNVSKTVSFAVAAFAPLFELIAAIVRLLANRWTVAALAVVASLFLMYGAVVAVMSAYTALMALNMTAWALYAMAGIEKIVLGLYAWVAAANTAYGSMARLLALTGVGLIAVGASVAVGSAVSRSMTPGGPGGGGGGMGGGRYGGQTNINIYGNVGNSEYQKMKDEFPSLYATEKNVDSVTEK